MRNTNFSLSVIALCAIVIFSGCNRNTGNDSRVDENVPVETIQPTIVDAQLITPEDPFKNQPNKFCTVIRKLDISYYAPNQEVEDVLKYPKKYCLLDVCLDGPSSNDNVVNLGEADEIVTSSYELIKVFNSLEETKAYVKQYAIEDVLYEE